MKTFLRIFLLAGLILLCGIPTSGQEPLWNKLCSKFDLLFQKENYSEAAKVAEEAFRVAGKTFGKDHPNVAVSLTNLGRVYHAQGKYTEAEPLYKRALDMREKALEPNYREVTILLNNLAVLYKVQGRYTEAESLYKRALAIREKTLVPHHPDIAISLNNLAVLYID